MSAYHTTNFSASLQKKVDELKSRRAETFLGKVFFRSPLILAPMSGITIAPFRFLMQLLGSGGSVTELISSHAINYGNERTLKMMSLHPNEKRVGIQLFGESAVSLRAAAEEAIKYRPDFIDINMGCPVRKVVGKGAGAALLKEPKKLIPFLRTIKHNFMTPLSIKIRTGWDSANLNAHEVCQIAYDEGVEFVTIHGRTQSEKYSGSANWSYMETLAQESKIPIVGNGDLYTPSLINTKLESTNTSALMIGRGALRNPFIFLESYLSAGERTPFTCADYFEVIKKFGDLVAQFASSERILLIQLRKHIVWLSAGNKGSSAFRQSVFKVKSYTELMDLTENYFMTLMVSREPVDDLHAAVPVMSCGHG